MAHSIEVDSFDHDGVKGLIDEAKPPQELFMNTTDGVKKVNLKSRTDKFLITVLRVLKVGFESVDHRR